MLRVDAAHGLDHLCQFHRRRQGLGTTFDDVAENDVKELARFGQHKVIKMSVADAACLNAKDDKSVITSEFLKKLVKIKNV